MLKVGVVGAGNISKTHLKAWKNIPEATIVALCDIRLEKAQEKARAFGARVYTSYEDMLHTEELDIMDVCTPTFLHADFSIRAMEQGIHTLMEKPLSLHHRDVARVYATAKARSVRVMVAHVLRFWHEYKLLKDAYESGRYGKLLSGWMTRLSNEPKGSWDHWMKDPARSGRAAYDLHIHDLDFILYAFGRPRDVRYNQAQTKNQDYLHAVYEFDSFFIAAEAAWYDCAYGFNCGYRFQFEHAVMELLHGKLTIHRQDGTKETVEEDGHGPDGAEIPVSNAYEKEIRYFVDCVLAGKDCDRVPPEQLEEALRLILRADPKIL